MYRKIEDHDVDGVGAFLRQAVATLPSSESVAYLGTDVIETLIQSMDPHLAGGGEPARRWTSDDIVRTLQVARLEPATLRELLSGAFSYLLRGAGLRDGLLTLLDEADVDWLLSDEPDGGRHDRY